MAMTGVLRPGHAQIRVLDMEESVEFYTNVLGLIETGRDSQGRVYFKAWDERDHNSVVLRQADQAGIDFFAFKVLDKAIEQQFEIIPNTLTSIPGIGKVYSAGIIAEIGDIRRFNSQTFVSKYAGLV